VRLPLASFLAASQQQILCYLVRFVGMAGIQQRTETVSFRMVADEC
jgi:hypothetical protein